MLKILAYAKSFVTKYCLPVLLIVVVSCPSSCASQQTVSTIAEITMSDDWDPPQGVPLPLEAAAWPDGPKISPDGNVLYFSLGRDRNVATYFSTRTADGWSVPTPLPINLQSFPTGAPHTQDGKTLYFSSIRPGGLGEADIYVCENSNGQWTNPVNLGPPVNTKYMESEPFISADGNTLYFASTRPGGKGGVDIWMSERTAGKWSEPRNLGEPVNTKQDETQPFVTADGAELYFMAMNRNNIPGPAIFRSLRQGQKWGEPTVVASGFVGQPSLTADKEYLYFVHINHKGAELVSAEIVVARKRHK